MQGIKILFIALSDQTGANIPMIKVAEALRKKDHYVQVLVRDKSEYNPIVTQLPPRVDYSSELGSVITPEGNIVRIKRDLKYLYNTINEDNSYQDTATVLNHLHFIPDIIFVGISFDFLTSTDILKLSQATQAHIYNVAVDMNHFTGGCHFAWDCDGYIKGCNTLKCPAILDDTYSFLAERNFQIKKENAKKGDFKILAGTKWTLEQAKKSNIYKDQKQYFNISGILDTEVFNCEKRDVAKKIFNLSEQTFYILAGSENTLDPRKGYDYFVKSLNHFWSMLKPEERERIEILSVTRQLDEETHSLIKFNKKHINYIKDERLLALLYQAADAYVNCSVEDSGPSMLIEALACGVPVVSFKTGSAQEYINNGETGFVVNNMNYQALSEALMKVYKMPPSKRDEMGKRGSEVIAKSGSMIQAILTLEQLFKSHFDYSETLSVALCTYNGAKYIHEQLDSILNQNPSPTEIVICDDLSEDDTWSILQVYQDKYPSVIKLHRNETRLGIVKNFEKALNLCTGDIIFLSDQDDIWSADKTKTILRIFDRNSEINAICHNQQISLNQNILSELTMWDTMGFSYYHKQNYIGKDYLSHTIFFGNMVSGAALCIRKPKSPITFVDGFREVIHDYQLAINYLLEGKLYFHNECLGIYRQHEGQQIGAVLNKVNQHTKSIHHFYGIKNPALNLLHIARRKRKEQIFSYINKIENVRLKAIVRNNIKSNLLAFLSIGMWSSQFKIIIRKIQNRIQRSN
jgi:glycosyltransferase involved in cell wall biosynthesis